MPGGVSDYARQWVLALAKTEAQPEVVVLTPADAPPEGSHRIVSVANKWTVGAWPRLLRVIEAEKPDVILVHYAPHMFQRQGLALAFTPFLLRLSARKLPVITIAHELYYSRKEPLRRQPVGWIQRIALLPLVTASRRVVVTVPDRLKRMREIFPRFPDRFRLLPVGRNIAPAPPGTFRQEHGVPEDATLLLFMGLVHPSKGFPLLERTLEELEARGLSFRLIVMGGGAINHPWAVNLGFVSFNEASRALSACDLALLPLTDGASTRRTSLINALGAGLPVVSTIGRNTDLAFLVDSVRMVPAADERAFIDATAELIQDPVARRALGERGRMLFERSLSWDVLGESWYSLLEEAVIA